MKLRAKTLILASGILLILVGVFRIVVSNPTTASQKNSPTRIQVGVMSEKQKEHSKLYSEYHAGRSLDSPPPKHGIHNRVNPKETPEETIIVEPGTPVTSSNGSNETFQDFLQGLSCKADAIVIAVAKDRTSQLTENRGFIFSDYNLAVEEVLHNNESGPIAPGESIIVTRPGGRIAIGERIITAIDESFKPLEEGNRYLLFLKYIPSTAAYQSIRKGSFLISDQTLIPLTEEFTPSAKNGSRAFDSETRSTLSVGCNKNR